MDRLIEVKVNGSLLTKDNLYAGVQGEANVTALRIEFDESWDGYAKTVVFWNARGENPVKRTLTADLLEDITASSRIYLCTIPGEPLEEAGECTVMIDGYAEGKRPRSVPAKLKVKPAPDSDNPSEPADPTPTQAEQLQAQIDNLLGDMQEQAVIAHNAAQTAGGHAQAAATSEVNAQQAATDAQAARASAEAGRDASASSASQAASAKAAAETAKSAAETARAGAEAAAANAKNSETAANAYATGAYQNAETAAERARDAQAAASRAESAQGNVEANAKAAQTAETGAKAAQKAAEAAQAAAENASHTALEEAKQQLSVYVSAGQSSAATAEAAKTAAENSASRAAAIAQAAEGYVGQAESSAASASSSAGEAERRAFAAATSEMNASSSATAASNSAGTAAEWAQAAETAAEYVAQARNDVRDLESSTVQNAAAATASATAAQTAETNAKAAQKAAEDARDAASEIAGGNFASKAEAQGYADTAESNANKYTDQKIAAIPTPDVSGQIGSHNTATDAHNDIRLLVEGLTTRLNALANSDDTTLDQMAEVVAYIKDNRELIDQITTGKVSVSDIVNNLTTNVANKPLSAAQGVALKALVDGLTTALGNKENAGLAAEIVGNHDTDDQSHIDIRQALDGTVKKSGADMTGPLSAPTLQAKEMGFTFSISPESAFSRVMLLAQDSRGGACALFIAANNGLAYMDVNGYEYPLIHTGNLAGYVGALQASLEE